MDELRGPSIQIVLHVKEGLGFGFLRSPFIVSGSLNGYILETDPSVPTHAPIFDAELVWEADKRRFRSLRVQNVPVKIEVFSLGTQGKKDKIGYLLLSLLGAQPCPANKLVDVKHTWHRLLGVKSEGKCCQPQLMLSLTIEDRLSTPTPRNELRMFHSNEVAYPPAYSTNNTLPGTNNTLPGKTMLLTLEEYIAESKRTVSCPELQPRLQCEDGLIQIGAGRQLFVLSVTIAAIDNLDLLLPDTLKDAKEGVDCHITYSVFTHNIMTDRVRSTTAAPGQTCALSQRSSLRLRCELSSLAQYFARCPLLVATVCARDTDIGVCSLDLRKLVPTDDLQQFLNTFCNSSGALSISERCYILRCSGVATDTSRRPYVDVQLCLKYVGLQKEAEKPRILTARSATQLESSKKTEPIDPEPSLDCKSGSCTNFEQDTGRVAYTNMGASNTARYKNASGDAIIQTNEIADMIKKMCESFAESQERIMSMRVKPATSDMQIQCDQQSQDVGGITDNTQPSQPTTDLEENTRSDVQFAGDGRVTRARDVTDDAEREPVRLETSKSDTCINQSEKEMVKQLISRADRDEIMQRFVDELEDWKEKQQQLFTCQLKRKEDYHLDLLGREWAKKRSELENKLRAGIEQCRTLAADLSRATDDFRLRGYRNCEREKKLLDAKTALEAHYTAKYQELREASQKMEDDMNHQLKMKDMRIEELEHQLMVMDKQMEVLKTNMKNCEKDAESRYSGLTKDQTASLIQELRCLEEKLDSATQSKSFFKEQWGRCVRELHQLKLTVRQLTLTRLRNDRKDLGLDTIQDEENSSVAVDNEEDLKKLKDDFYVDLLVNTPGLESHSILSNAGPGGLDMFEDNMNPPNNQLNSKLSSLISERSQLVTRASPDEDRLLQLNKDIRALLLTS